MLPKHIGTTYPKPSHKAFYRVRMVFNLPITQDVLNRCALLTKAASRQNSSVAIKRFLFRTHEGDAVLARAFLHALDSALEEIGLGEEVIFNLAISVATFVFRACAQFLAREDVFDSDFAEGGFQLLTIELRVYTAVGAGPHIAHRCDVVFTQQIDERTDWVR